jgi:chemotaxis protein MotB
VVRRRRQEEHENHERWLVSYSDFITLLFAFFVVMYSISSVNEGKYKIVSESLTNVFNQPERSEQPIAVSDGRLFSGGQGRSEDEAAEKQSDGTLQSIADSVRKEFGDLLAGDQLKVRGNEQWIEIELSSGLLFPSGEALPNDEAFTIIERVAKILAPYANPVQVEGFTDNQPIATSQFPSNWELSTARAASVVRMLTLYGVSASRLAAVGYGEFQPAADNATAAGRARNRRVVLAVSRHLEVRRGFADQPAAFRNQSGMQPARTPQAMVPQETGANSPSSAP